MKITALLDNFNDFIQKKGVLDPEITNTQFDSRLAKDGTLFFALEGIHTDGHNFINKAIELGAKAVCHTRDLDNYREDIVYIKVENSRVAMSKLSAKLFGYPSRELKVIGVTGTDGKSTTVFLLDQLLTLLGKNCGFISTISFKSGDKEDKNALRQSTPESSQIHSILRDMVNNGKEYAIVESTSHGLSNKTSRLRDVEYDAGILTNITQEHLEFHGTIEQYREDKGNLFRMVSKTSKCSFSVLNYDDPVCEKFTSYTAPKKSYTYSLKSPDSTLYAKDIELQESGSDFTLVFKGEDYNTRLNLPGIFNIENLMGTVLTIHKLTKEPMDRIVSLIPELTSVKGRLNPVHSRADFSILVDYAHTPGSFKKLFPSIRKSIKGRIIAVFGSAGERDIEKRAIQGAVADQYADIIILTNEDPRLEDPVKIINDIKSGVKNKTLDKDLFLIEDRKEAIAKAIDIAKKDDMILTLGKGHESTIECINGPKPWDEPEVIKEILRDKGYL